MSTIIKALRELYVDLQKVNAYTTMHNRKRTDFSGMIYMEYLTTRRYLYHLTMVEVRCYIIYGCFLNSIFILLGGLAHIPTTERVFIQDYKIAYYITENI